MQLKLRSIIFILLFIGCSPKIIVPEAPPPKVILGVSLRFAEPYHNYSIKEINNNIDNSLTVINMLQDKIKELEKEPQSEENKKKIEKLEKDIDVINDEVIQSWENSQYTSDEYRKKNNELPDKTSYSAKDFVNFLDIQKGKTMGDITAKFGKTKHIEKTSLSYIKNGKEILRAKSDAYNRITQIEIIGKEGLRFAQQKNISDKSFYFLGMNISKIEEYFPEGLSSPAGGFSGTKTSEIYRTGSIYSDGAKVTFTCPRGKSFFCESILVEWE